MTTRLPNSVGVWHEASGSGSSIALTRLAPYLTPAGYWVLLPASVAIPAGYTLGAMTGAGAYLLLDSTTTSGKRLTRAASAAVLIY